MNILFYVLKKALESGSRDITSFTVIKDVSSYVVYILLLSNQMIH